MKVVELEALDESAVQQASDRAAGRASPADDRALATAFEARYGLDSDARPRQLGADQRAGDAVEDHVLGALLDIRGNSPQREVPQPTGQLTGGSPNVAGRLVDTFESQIAGHRPSPRQVVAGVGLVRASRVFQPPPATRGG